MTHPLVSRQDYEARIDAEQSRLLDVKRDWTAVMKAVTKLRDNQVIGADVYQAVEDTARKAMEPVNRHLDALTGMANDMKVMARQPNFSRREAPEATVFDSKGRRNESGLIEFPTRSDRFD